MNNTTPAIDFEKLSKSAASRQLRMRLHQRKFQESLVFTYAGRLFRTDMERLVGYLHLKNHAQAPYVLMDMNNLPAMIDDIDEFIQTFVDTNQSAALTFYKALEEES